MPMTLEQMKVGMSDKVAQKVVDIFLRQSEILQLIPFDNCVSPQGGSTLTYTYMQTYFNMDGDNSVMGYPRSLLVFLKPYMKARF